MYCPTCVPFCFYTFPAFESSCHAVCGDGYVNTWFGETCDTGNSSGVIEGCDSNCSAAKIGFSCTGGDH
jgi:hypothetical protein